MQLIFQYPLWFILFCLLLGGIYASLLYFKNNVFTLETKHTNKIIFGLALLRFLSAGIIAFLLLSPFIKKKQIDKIQPVLVLAHDNSESIKLNWDKEDSTNYINKLNSVLTDLSKDFEIQYFAFDEDIKAVDTLDFKGKASDLSNALEQINGTFYNQNVGAVIFASDGIYNKGNNPYYTTFDFPLYTIALGDTNIQTDAKIMFVRNNKLAYLDDKLEIEVGLQANHLANKNYTVSIAKIGKNSSQKLESKTLQIKNDFDEQETSFIINASSVGIHKYRVSIQEFENEVTTKNNYYDFYIEVIDNRQKILLVANAPHPDIAAIKSVVEKNKNYELDIQYINKFSANLDPYSLVIVHQLPAKANRGNSVFNAIQKSNIPVWYITGAMSNYNELNTIQNACNVTVKSNSNNDASPVFNTNFSSFNLSESTINAFKDFPPLQTPFGSYQIANNTTVCLLQKIGTVVSDYPILAFQDNLNKRNAILIGDGLWRWKMYDYYENGATTAFDEIIEKTINYLALKGDKRKFRINTNKNNFYEGEKVIFEAELYNDNYELINTPEVNILIKNDDNNEFPFAMTKTAKAYLYETESLPIGNYNYTASTTFNGKKLTASGAFSIEALQLEATQTQANHTLLHQLANKTNGKYYMAKDVENVKNDILNNENIKPLLYESSKTMPIINLYGLFFAILFLLTLEWFIRKWLGGY